MQSLKKIDKRIGSPDENTRWQAAIALGKSCETNPAAIWPLTLKWGSSDDEDVRAAISTCVLEHILEYHFAEYFPKVARFVYDGNENFTDTFHTCWKFGNAKIAQNNARWDDLKTFIQTRNAAKQEIAEQKAFFKRKRKRFPNEKTRR